MSPPVSLLPALPLLLPALPLLLLLLQLPASPAWLPACQTCGFEDGGVEALRLLVCCGSRHHTALGRHEEGLQDLHPAQSIEINIY